MKHLIVKALHRDESFLAGGTDILFETLRKSGETVYVRDLYHEQFQPVLTQEDFGALNTGRLPSDIALEQEYIKNADILWLVFPVWWSSMPAILKGYIDRVFLSGFAYKMHDERPVGLLTDKKVVILNSMGMSREEYIETGMFDALRLTIDTGIFKFSGMQVIEHKYFTSIMSATHALRRKYLDEIAVLAKQVAGLKHNNQKTLGKNVA